MTRNDRKYLRACACVCLHSRMCMSASSGHGCKPAQVALEESKDANHDLQERLELVSAAVTVYSAHDKAPVHANLIRIADLHPLRHNICNGWYHSQQSAPLSAAHRCSLFSMIAGCPLRLDNACGHPAHAACTARLSDHFSLLPCSERAIVVLLTFLFLTKRLFDSQSAYCHRYDLQTWSCMHAQSRKEAAGQATAVEQKMC